MSTLGGMPIGMRPSLEGRYDEVEKDRCHGARSAGARNMGIELMQGDETAVTDFCIVCVLFGANIVSRA